MRSAKLAKLCVPRVYGGAQAHPATVLAVIEELAKGDRRNRASRAFEQAF